MTQSTSTAQSSIASRDSEAVEHAEGFIKFVNASPSPYHAIHNIKSELEAAGFEKITEAEDWDHTVEPGGKYYVTRNASSIIAFAVGEHWKPGKPLAAVGCHTDSPCLRVKPYSKRQHEGYLQVGVETYGGGQWHTWYDRDLSLAGRVMVRAKDGRFVQRLVDMNKALLRIPTLAIHLERTGDNNFQFDKVTSQVLRPCMEANKSSRKNSSSPSRAWQLQN